MQNIDFSLVIPVYNTPEEDIRQCLASIRTNTTCSYEILLVDDGSETATAAFLDTLTDPEGMVRVFHQENGGVSRARNLGTEEAKGTYVTYVDSDDLLTEGILDALWPVLREKQPGLLITRIAREASKLQGDEDWETGGEDIKQELREYYLTFADPRFREKTAWINRAPHGRFLKKELALETPFLEDFAFGEDVLWNFALLNRAEEVLLYRGIGYCYREVETSATQKYRPEFPKEVRRLLREYRREMEGWTDKKEELYYVSAVEYFTILMRVYVFAGEKETSWKRYHREVHTNFWREVFRKVKPSRLSGRYRLAGLLGKCHLYRPMYLMFRLHHS